MLITKDGTIGKIAVVRGLTGEATLNSGVFVVRPTNEEYTTDFLYWVLKSSVFTGFVNFTSKGSTIIHLYQDVFINLQNALPPLSEQTAIASYLDEKTTQLDTLIDRKRRLIDLLREEKTALINEAVTKGINPDAPMKDSGIEWLGEIPAHWEVRKLKFIAETISKGTTPSTEGREILPEGEIRFIKAENIQEGLLCRKPSFFIDEQTNEVIKRSKLKERDILIVIAGATIGKIAIMESAFLPANTNQAVCFIRPKENEIERFIWYWLQSSFIYEIIWLEAVQSAQPNLSMERIGNFVIPSLSSWEQVKIVAHLDAETAKTDYTISRIEHEIELMQEYRTALISEVVTGKVCVV